MEYVSLGRTGLMTSRTSLGALPLQRVSEEEAVRIIRLAYDGGINFFDTARAYSDSEKKIGYAFYDIRKDVFIATKTAASDGKAVMRDLETSLGELQSDYIDVYQLHNPSFVPVPGGPDGIYDALLKAKRDGKIRFIGITNHSAQVAREAVMSGLYDTLQFPFSLLASDIDRELVKLCGEKNVGFIAMKALCGGLLTNIPLAFGYLRMFEQAVPVWGMQKEDEVRQILYFESHPPVVDSDFMEEIEKERRELSGNFCRGCGYCLPCPAGIPINDANRMSQLLRRSPASNWLTPEWREKMEKIRGCTRCGACEKRCPYHLKPYETLPAHLKDYLDMYGRFG